MSQIAHGAAVTWAAARAGLAGAAKVDVGGSVVGVVGLGDGAGVGVEVLQGSRWAWLVELDFVHEERTGNTTVSPQAGISYYW